MQNLSLIIHSLKNYILDFSKIFIFIFIFSVPLIWFSTNSAFEKLNHQQVEQQQSRIYYLKSSIDSYLKENKEFEACQKLQTEYETQSIQAYLLVSKNVTCYQPENFKVLPPVTKRGELQLLKVGETPLQFLREKNEVTEAEWTLATAPVEKLNLWSSLHKSKIILYSFLADIAVIVYSVFIFIFLALVIFVTKMQSFLQKKDFSQKKAISKFYKFIFNTFGWLKFEDLKLIEIATAHLASEKKQLEMDLELYKTSLEQSLRKEIEEKNQSLPFTFLGVVTKVDINGFSKVLKNENEKFAQSDKTQFNKTAQLTEALENFGCELLLRYQGLFEKTVGDEIVVVFRGAYAKNRALAFSRDLMTEFSNKEFYLNNSLQKFTLKASVAESMITFNKRPSGYGFSGDALTITTRLLDQIKDKSCNFICAPVDFKEELQQLCQQNLVQEKFVLKNIGEADGFLVSHFNDINFQNELDFFRADYHILKSIQFVKTCFLTQEALIPFQKIYGHLSSIYCLNVSKEVVDEWFLVLQLIYNASLKNTRYMNELVSWLSLAKQLVPAAQWTSAMNDFLLSLPSDLDARLNATLIEVMSSKNFSYDYADLYAFARPLNASMNTQVSFRAHGNLLIAQAHLQLKDSVLIDVIKMLKSENNNEVMTGIYVALAILRKYQTKNYSELASLKSYSLFLKVFKKCYQAHSSKLSERLNYFSSALEHKKEFEFIKKSNKLSVKELS